MLFSASGDEEEVFSDAQEDPKPSSRTNSPIPTTRVEKVRLITTEYALPKPDLVRSTIEIAMATFPALKLTI